MSGNDSHYLSNITSTSGYIQDPVVRRKFQSGDRVVICRKNNVAFLFSTYQELRADWRERCPFCEDDLNLSNTGSQPSKPKPEVQPSTNTGSRSTYTPVVAGFGLGSLLLFAIALVFCFGLGLIAFYGSSQPKPLSTEVPNAVEPPQEQPTRAPTRVVESGATPETIPTLLPTATRVKVLSTATQAGLRCANARPTRLEIGMRAYVSYDPPNPNRIRENPGKDGKYLGQMYPGEFFTVIDGPECVDDLIWWEVVAEKDGLTGWTVEGDANDYWVVPVP